MKLDDTAEREVRALIEQDALDTLYATRMPGVSPLTAEAFARLDRLIWEGRLVPGQRLVERHLSVELDIPRGYVREAVRLLAADGVVELNQNRGASVRHLGISDLLNIADALTGVLFRGVDIFATRCREFPSSYGELIYLCVERIERAPVETDVFGLVIRSIDFHAAINRLIGNPYLNMLISRLHVSLYHRELIRFIPLSVAHSSVPNHRIVADALLNGDAAKARAALDRNLEPTVKLLRELQARQASEPPPLRGRRAASSAADRRLPGN